MFYCKFLAESKGERILKIGKHLAKLLMENIVGFFDSQCTVVSLSSILISIDSVVTRSLHMTVVCHGVLDI